MNIRMYLLVLLFSLGLFGCGGGGDDAEGGGEPNDLKQGVFDGVSGLSYKTSSGSQGETGEGGEYSYAAGDTVTFFYQDITLGTVPAGAVITPINFLNPELVLQALYTLDEDLEPINGIQLSAGGGSRSFVGVRGSEQPKNVENFSVNLDDKVEDGEAYYQLLRSYSKSGLVVDDRKAITYEIYLRNIELLGIDPVLPKYILGEYQVPGTFRAVEDLYQANRDSDLYRRLQRYAYSRQFMQEQAALAAEFSREVTDVDAVYDGYLATIQDQIDWVDARHSEMSAVTSALSSDSKSKALVLQAIKLLIKKAVDNGVVEVKAPAGAGQLGQAAVNRYATFVHKCLINSGLDLATANFSDDSLDSALASCAATVVAETAKFAVEAMVADDPVLESVGDGVKDLIDVYAVIFTDCRKGAKLDFNEFSACVKGITVDFGYKQVAKTIAAASGVLQLARAYSDFEVPNLAYERLSLLSHLGSVENVLRYLDAVCTSGTPCEEQKGSIFDEYFALENDGREYDEPHPKYLYLLQKIHLSQPYSRGALSSTELFHAWGEYKKLLARFLHHLNQLQQAPLYAPLYVYDSDDQPAGLNQDYAGVVESLRKINVVLAEVSEHGPSEARICADVTNLGVFPLEVSFSDVSLVTTDTTIDGLQTSPAYWQRLGGSVVSQESSRLCSLYSFPGSLNVSEYEEVGVTARVAYRLAGNDHVLGFVRSKSFFSGNRDVDETGFALQLQPEYLEDGRVRVHLIARDASGFNLVGIDTDWVVDGATVDVSVDSLVEVSDIGAGAEVTATVTSRKDELVGVVSRMVFPAKSASVGPLKVAPLVEDAASGARVQVVAPISGGVPPYTITYSAGEHVEQVTQVGNKADVLVTNNTSGSTLIGSVLVSVLDSAGNTAEADYKIHIRSQNRVELAFEMETLADGSVVSPTRRVIKQWWLTNVSGRDLEQVKLIRVAGRTSLSHIGTPRHSNFVWRDGSRRSLDLSIENKSERYGRHYASWKLVHGPDEEPVYFRGSNAPAIIWYDLYAGFNSVESLAAEPSRAIAVGETVEYTLHTRYRTYAVGVYLDGDHIGNATSSNEGTGWVYQHRFSQPGDYSLEFRVFNYGPTSTAELSQTVISDDAIGRLSVNPARGYAGDSFAFAAERLSELPSEYNVAIEFKADGVWGSRRFMDIEGNTYVHETNVNVAGERAFRVGVVTSEGDLLGRWRQLPFIVDEAQEVPPELTEASASPSTVTSGERITFRTSSDKPVNSPYKVYFEYKNTDGSNGWFGRQSLSGSASFSYSATINEAGSNRRARFVIEDGGGSIVSERQVTFTVNEQESIGRIDGLSPRTATKDERQSFSISGLDFPTTVAFSVEDCDGGSTTRHSASSATHSCVPRATGSKRLYGAMESGGQHLTNSGTYTVQVSEAIVAPKLSSASASPSTITSGERITFRASSDRPVGSPYRVYFEYKNTDGSNGWFGRQSLSGSASFSYSATINEAGSNRRARFVIEDGGGSMISERQITFTVEPAGSPDLTASVATNKSTYAAGESIRIDATIRNGGSAPSPGGTLKYYASTNSTITTSDQEIGSDTFSGISAGGSASEYMNRSTSSTTSGGTIYFGACVVPVSGESDTGNNCSSGKRVTIEPAGSPDLTASVTTNKSTYAAGESIRIDAMIRNDGSAPSPGGTLKYYASTNSTITTSDQEIGSDTFSGISAGGSASEYMNRSTSSTGSGGTIYFGVCVVPVSGESDTGNNCSSGKRVTIEPGQQ